MTTYPELGATRNDVLPAGYAHVDRDEKIGHGRRHFEAAAEKLFRWGMHRGAGLRIARDTPRAAENVEVRMRALGLLPAPCRVVWTVWDDAERGFAYGTLPGHPESGEEAFVLRLTPDGEVRMRIRAFSRHATPLARLGGPLTTAGQRVVTTLYFRALTR